MELLRFKCGVHGACLEEMVSDLPGALVNSFRKWKVKLVPIQMGANLFVADAGIDDDALALRLADERMDTHFNIPSWLAKVGNSQSPFS
jgi:hypothetical protein